MTDHGVVSVASFVCTLVLIPVSGWGAEAAPRPRAAVESESTSFRNRHAVSIQQTVAPVPLRKLRCRRNDGEASDDAGAQLDLAWCHVFFQGPKWQGQKPVLVTCHDNHGAQVVRFYAGENGLFAPKHEICFAQGGRFEQAERFQVGHHAFMFFRHNSGGSSSAYNYRGVWLTKLYSDKPELPAVREIPIEDPVTAFSSCVLKKDQSSPLDRTYIESESAGLKFRFSIWNDGDRSNFPTGGSVTGNLELVLDKHGNPVRFVTGQVTFRIAS